MQRIMTLNISQKYTIIFLWFKSLIFIKPINENEKYYINIRTS